MRIHTAAILIFLLSSFTPCRASGNQDSTVWNRLFLTKDSLTENLKKAELYRNENADSGLKYLNSALQSARSLNDYKSQAQILSDQILIYKTQEKAGKISETQKEMISVNKHLLSAFGEKEQIAVLLMIADGYAHANTDSAFYYYDRVISKSKDLHDAKSEAYAYLNTGYIYANIEDNSKALERYRTALELFEKQNDKKGMAESLQAISKLFIFFDNYGQALSLEKEAAKNYKEIKDYDGYYKSMRHIGEIYLSTGRYNKSLEVLNSAVISAKKENKKSIVSSLYQSMGNYYSTTKDYKKAIDYLKKGLYLRIHDKEPVIRIVNNYNSLGNAYRKKGEYDSSLECYYKALKLLQKSDNLIALSKTQNNLAKTYAETGNILKSIDFLKRSIRNAETIGNRYSILYSYSELINNYVKIKNYRSALESLKKYSVLKDSLELYSDRNKIESFKNIYEKEKKANDIEHLKSEERKIILIAKLGIALLSLIVLLVLFSRYKIKASSNKRLVDRNKKIAEMLREVSELNDSLKKSEDTYRNLFERNPLPMMILREETERITAVNIAAINHYGYSKEEFLSLTCKDLHQSSHSHGSECGVKLYSPAAEKIANIRHQKHNGDFIDVEVLSHPFLFEGKEAYNIIIQDVTERKRAESAVMESEERYRNLFEASPDAVILIDRRLRIIKDANPAAAVLFRNTWTDLIGTDYLDLFRISDRNKIENYFDAMNKDSNKEIMETEILRSDDTRVPIEVSGRCVKLPHFNVYQVNIRDISSQKEAEEMLRQSERRLLRTQKIAHVGNWELDLKTHKIWISGEGCSIVGLKETENYISAEKMIGIIDKEDKQKFNTAIGQLIRDGKGFDITLKIFRLENGEARIIHSRAEAIRDENGRTVKILGAIRDITELKKYQDELIRAKEEAELSNKRKSDFLAQMSHEIRSPVNVILSFASLIREELNQNADDDIKACFNAIDNGGRRLIRTIDLVLNIADMQSGEYDLNPERIDLAKDIIENLMLEFRSAASGKNLGLHFVKEADEVKIFADRYTITQIFANLIDNAIKYTKSGSIKIRLFREMNSVGVSIEDTGIGISKDYLPHLFVPFSRERQSYSGKHNGSGLGLSLVQKYCDLNRAVIKVESEKGKGSSFTVIFPDEKILAV